MSSSKAQSASPEGPSTSAASSAKKSGSSSLLAPRQVLVVDEEGQRRDETVEVVQKILPNAAISVATGPDEAKAKMESKEFDTFVINLLMPGYSSSEFVKSVANHPKHPILIGFAADKMSDAFDPRRGIKLKPLKRLFEIDNYRAKKSASTNPDD